jgi:DNA-nicking Smr family endonuclease
LSGKKKSASTGRAFEALRDLRDALKREGEPAPPPKAPPPASVSPAPPKRAEDDARLLRRAYAGVEPLDRSKGRPTAPADDAAVHQRLRVLALGSTPFEVSDEGDRVEGRRTDVPLEVLRRLRRGHFPIDARLDLHGMVAQEARARVESFLRTTRERRERVVLVIHGKGEHSPLGVGVLRGEISAWLSQGASSKHVAAFATARDGDGGPGAVYVMLRR